jgi:hypothetical protein
MLVVPSLIYGVYVRGRHIAAVIELLSNRIRDIMNSSLVDVRWLERKRRRR